MRHLTVLLLVAIFSCVLPVPLQKNDDNPKNGKIVGGKETTILRFPYQVSILFRWDKVTWTHICGGAIISGFYIITAAHCVKDGDGIVRRPKELRVRVGSSYRTSGGTMLKTRSIKMHPQYDASKTNDVAIIQLKEELDFDDESTQPITLFNCDEDDVSSGDKLIISGWGRTASEGDRPDLLLTTKVYLLPQEICEKAYSPAVITDTMFCAGAPGRDACQGDSGGPIVDKDKLVGVVSWGKNCADLNHPGIYTNLSCPSVKEWINSETGL